jgi:hypothetical protein
MQETNVEADMSEDPTDRPLTDRELAQLLHAHADAIADGDETRERVLRDVLQLVARETPNVKQRIDTVGTRGRVSFGRDNAGVHGTALFVPDHVVGASELEGVGPDGDGGDGQGEP